MRNPTILLLLLVLGLLVGLSATAGAQTLFLYRGSLVQSPNQDGTYYKEVTAGDLDNDGRPDLYLPQLRPFGEGPTTDHVYLATGAPLENLAGAFSFVPTATAFPASFTTNRGYDAELADLDKDGNLDIIRPDRLHHLHVLWGQGDGTFPNVTTLVTPLNDPNPVGNYDNVDFDDLDGDGDLDFIVAEYASSGTNLLVENRHSQGQSRQFNLHVNTNLTANLTHSISLGDYTADGLPDVILANLSTYSQAYPAQGGLSYQLLTNLGQSAGKSTDSPVADLVDLNLDSRLDVYVGRPGESFIFFHSGNNADPYGGTPVSAPGNQDVYVYDARYGDLDMDGQMEIVDIDCCSSTSPTLRVLRVSGPSVSTVTADFIDQAHGSLALELSDLDVDGDEDLLVGGSTGAAGNNISAVYVWENRLFMRLTNKTVTSSASYLAFKTLSALDGVSLVNGSQVTFTAGEKIVLQPGFSVDEGATLTATIDPDLW